MNQARWLMAWLGRLARRTRLCYALAVLAPLFTLLLGVWRQGVPYPEVHDEFSYLLGADTFARGRLTNPTPPSVGHFESMHILVEPSYASKYPAGQAFFLAIGQVLIGHPYAGVVLEICGLCLATLWGLRGMLSRRAALLGMVCAWWALGVSFYWARSYWGGAIAFSAAMLAVGATARLVRGYSWQANLALATGVSLLFFSRPVEGGALTVCLGLWLWRAAPWRRVLPLLTMFAVMVLGVQSQINQAVTGSVWTMPYVEHARQYLSAPFFWVLPVDERPKSGGEALTLQREKELWQARRDSGFALALLEGFLRLEFSMPRSFSLFSGLVLGWLLVRRQLAGWLKILAVLAGVAVFSTWLFAHYLAPLLSVYWVVLFGSLEQLRLVRWRGRKAGAAMALLLMGFFLAEPMKANWALFFGPEPPSPPRQVVEQRLRELGGQHIVFVRRAPGYAITDEWVYNGARLDHQAILFVRDLGPEANGRLSEVFPGRQPWLCEPERRDAQGYPSLSSVALKSSP